MYRNERLDKTLDGLGVSPIEARRILLWLFEVVPQREYPEFWDCIPGSGQEGAYLNQCRGTMTLGSMVEKLTKCLHSGETSAEEYRRELDELSQKFVALGLNYFNWDYLPPKTGAPFIFQVGRERLLEANPKVLGTISAGAYNILHLHLQRNVTIRNMLDTVWCRKKNDILGMGHSMKSFLDTARKLMELGFTYDDGIFLQEGTRKRFIEKTVADGVPEDKAGYLADRYVGNGRIRFYLDEIREEVDKAVRERVTPFIRRRTGTA